MGVEFLSRLYRIRDVAFALLAVAVLAAPAQVSAGPDDVLFASPNRILRLQDDPWSGGVWAGTEGGLIFRDLDSGALRHYSVSAGLPGAVVHDVDATAERVWIATGLGPAVLDKSSQEIQPLLKPSGDPFVTGVRTVFSEQDQVWLGTLGLGLYSVDKETLVAEEVPNPHNGSSFTHPILGLDAVGEDLYISAKGYGLVRWDRATGETMLFNYTYNQPEPKYLRIAATADDVWVGTEGDGVIRVHRSDWSLTEYASPKTTNALGVLSPLPVGTTTWFASMNNVARYESTTNQWRHWSDVPAGDVGGSANDIVLAQGVLYAATGNGDVVRYDPERDHWFSAGWWSPAQVLHNNAVQSCEVEPTGHLVFGTAGGGASIFDPEERSLVRFGREPDAKGQPRDINILDTAYDGERRYFATYNGVSELDLASGEYTNYYVDGRGPDDSGWGWNIVNDIELDGDQVWFGVQSNQERRARSYEDAPWHPGKVTRLDRATGQMFMYGEEAGLSDGNVTTIADDGDHLWIGMEKGGLDRLDKASGSIEHVYPANGELAVHDLLVTDDNVWATSSEGLLRLERDGNIQNVDALETQLPWSLEMVDGTLWIGTYMRGLFALDPDTLEAKWYGEGQTFDHMAYCIAHRDGLLYMGTHWGVERFDLESRTFLGHLLAPAVSSGHGTPQGSISIETPEHGENVTGQVLSVTGKADAPPGASVSVRVGDGPWQPATGVASWSAELTIDELPRKFLFSARLQADGHVLAEAFRSIHKARSAGETSEELAPSPAAQHTPVLDAYTREPVTFNVAVENAPQGTQAFLDLRRPGEGAFERTAMERNGGIFTAVADPFDEAGSAAYRIVIDWGDSSDRLPAPFDGFGDSYPLRVKDPAGAASAAVTGTTRFVVGSGVQEEIEVQVQNVGSRDGVFEVQLSGPLGALASSQESLLVPAGESRPLAIGLDGSSIGKDDILTLTLTPQGLGTPTEVPLRVSVDGSQPLHDQDVPMPLWALLAAVALMLARRREVG